MTTAAEALEAARQKLRSEQARIELLEAQIAKDSEIADQWKIGLKVDEIVAKLELPRDRVRRVLVEQGLLSVRKRNLTPQETHEVTSDLKSGQGVAEVVEKRNVAEAVVRRIAKQNNIAAPRHTTPRRSPAEIERIRQLDAAVKKEFGAGLSALGEALRKANKDAPPPTATSVGDDEPLVEAPIPPDVADTAEQHDPAGDAPREHHGDGEEPLPVELSPEDEAAMKEPDEVPW